MSIASWLERLKQWRRLELDEDEFREEVRAHLAMAEEEHVAEGADRQAARYAALKEFGNVTLTTEAARRVWMPAWLEALRNVFGDVRYALRTLARRPGFALTVVGVLTLGIGVNAAVFTMIKSLGLTPLAGVARSASLAVVFAETHAGRPARLSYMDYRTLRDDDRAFSGLIGSAVGTVNLGKGRNARPIWAELVTGNYFQVLGVRAALGRTLMLSDEIAPGRHPVVVISDGLWRRGFNADPYVVGRTIEVGNQHLTVVGVADPGFHGTTVVYDTEVYIPVTMAPELGFRFGSRRTSPAEILSDPRAAVFYPMGFLRPGTSLANAAAETDALRSDLSRDRPVVDAPARLRVVPFWQMPGGAPSIILPTLMGLSAMGLLVLTIACANIAGLVLVRGVSRRGEIAVRLALGATRTRIVRLLIVENLVLALPGAFLGALLARQAIPVLVGYARSLAAPSLLFFNIEMDAIVIGFAVMVACGSALLFGFIPALQSSRVDLVTVINEDASPRGAARGRLRSGLVVAQVAVSLLLLVGAGLAARSVEAARRTNPGFDATQVTIVALDVQQNGYDEGRGRVFYRKLLDAVRTDAGIESASLAAYTPLGFLDTRTEHVAVDGYQPRREEDLAFMSNVVGPGYFRTLRIPVLAGRSFEDRDDSSSEPVAVVNRTFADRFWGGAANAVGRRIRMGEGEWRTVIGVAADVKYSRINEAPRPYVYLPFFQVYRPTMTLHARGPAPIDTLLQQARAAVASLDADMPILFARPMSGEMRGALMLFDLTATMLVVFGVAGMALAAMGTYGLVSYLVRQSTHEIGIRMALGASTASIVWRFLSRGLTLGACGAAIGVIAAIGIGRLIGSVLFGVSATDASSFARALGIVLGTVLIATAAPAWRAARTSALSALRHQ